MITSVNPNEAKLSITTHILDVSRGVPADGLAVRLYKFENDKWIFLKERYIFCIILLPNIFSRFFSKEEI